PRAAGGIAAALAGSACPWSPFTPRRSASSLPREPRASIAWSRSVRRRETSSSRRTMVSARITAIAARYGTGHRPPDCGHGPVADLAGELVEHHRAWATERASGAARRRYHRGGSDAMTSVEQFAAFVVRARYEDL